MVTDMQKHRTRKGEFEKAAWWGLATILLLVIPCVYPLAIVTGFMIIFYIMSAMGVTDHEETEAKKETENKRRP
jgi:hypothetical protein